MTTKTIIKKAIYLNDKLFKEQTEYGNSNLYFTEVSDTLNGCFSSGNVDTSTGEANILNAPGSGTQITAWTQPVLTANGVLGGDSFAVAASNENSGAAYRAVDGVSGTNWQCSQGAVSYTIYNPQPLNITNIAVSAYSSVHNMQGTITVSGSNDGAEWASLLTYMPSGSGWQTGNLSLSNNTEFYNYYKIESTGAGSGGIAIDSFVITATCIVSVSTAETLFFNVGGQYPLLKGKLADGTMFERSSIPSISVANLTDGDYNVFVGMDSQEVLSSSYTISKVEPSVKVVGDVWRNTSISPFIDSKYSEAESWENYDKIYCGSITVESGVITNTIQPIFNENGMNESYLVKTYTNGSSWYRVYSDGWCEQGGTYQGTSGGNDRSYSINLLKNYANSTYNLVGLVTSEGGSGSYINTVKVSSKTESMFGIKVSGSEAFTWDWVAKGYTE